MRTRGLIDGNRLYLEADAAGPDWIKQIELRTGVMLNDCAVLRQRNDPRLVWVAADRLDLRYIRTFHRRPASEFEPPHYVLTELAAAAACLKIADYKTGEPI